MLVETTLLKLLRNYIKQGYPDAGIYII